MNPPYVRHHTLTYTKIQKYSKTTNSICKLKKTSDLWAYFLAKALGHIKEGGSIGAILPWSFLQADYARDIRKLLSNKFKHIKIVS